MKRFYLLDIARGVAATAVAIFHYKLFYSYNINQNVLEQGKQPFFKYINFFYDHGWIAVQFFFLLSGFVFFKLYLEKIYKKKISFYNFLILRISRLYPLHLITLILVLIIYIFLNKNNYFNPIQADFEHFFYNLFLIHEWGLSSFASFNEPSWSISIEFLMYLIFFYLALNQKIIFYSILMVLISSMAFFKFKLIGYGGYCFFIGGLSLLFFDYIKTTQKIKILCLSSLIIISTLLIVNLNYGSIFNKIILFTILFPSLINLLYIINLYLPKIGEKFSFFGDISYSIYLIHFPIILIILLASNSLNLILDFNSPLIFLAYLTITFLISFFSYNYVEIPLKKTMRKKFLINDQ